MRLQVLVAASHGGSHQTPTGSVLFILILLAVLYAAWRSGGLGKLRGAAGVLRLRGELRGVRIRPTALVPTALLLIVIAVLVITR